MITLEEFVNLYTPEFETDQLKIQLYTLVKVGDLSTTTKLGTYNVKNKTIENLDGSRLIVEKFTVLDRTKTDENMTMDIFVSEKPGLSLRSLK